MKKYTSTLLLLMAAIIWGSAFVAQKEATIIPPFTLVTLRSVIAGIFLIFVIIFSDWIKKNGRRLFSKAGIGITKRELIGGVICGAFLMIATVLQQIGIRGTEAGKASFITSLYVVIVSIYSLFFGKRSPLSTWIAVGGAVTGFFLLCIKDGFIIELADLYVLLCAFVFAMQIIAIDRSLPGCDGIRLSCVQFFTVALISGIAALIFERDQSFVLIGDAIPEILYLGICSSGIAYTCQIVGQKGTHPAVASIVLSLESVFGVLSAAIILGETLTLREYLGCAVVFCSVLLSQLEIGKGSSANPNNNAKSKSS